MPLTVRPARWSDDAAAVAALDTSFSTDRVYRVRRGSLSFELVLEPIDPPFHKSFTEQLAAEAPRLRAIEHVVVAEDGGRVVGIASAELSSWNRRVQVDHFYVARAARRAGVGRALLASIVAYARTRDAACVWLETQNVNYPAVQFYQRLGFRLCGIDDRFYDQPAATTHETALFFALDLEP